MAPDSDARVNAESPQRPTEPHVMHVTVAGKLVCGLVGLLSLGAIVLIAACAPSRLASSHYALGDVCGMIISILFPFSAFLLFLSIFTTKVELGADFIAKETALSHRKQVSKSDINFVRYASGKTEWILVWTGNSSKRRFMPRMSIPISFLSKNDALKIIGFTKEHLDQHAKEVEAEAEKVGIAYAAWYLAAIYLIFFAALGYAIYKYYLPAATP